MRCRYRPYRPNRDFQARSSSAEQAADTVAGTAADIAAGTEPVAAVPAAAGRTGHRTGRTAAGAVHITAEWAVHMQAAVAAGTAPAEAEPAVRAEPESAGWQTYFCRGSWMEQGSRTLRAG